MQISLLNGQPGTFPPDHRALSYGDGLFETLLIQGDSACFLDEHLARMSKGAKQLALNWTEPDEQGLRNQLQALMKGLMEPHVLKLMLLRSAPGRGYAYDPDAQHTDLVIQIQPYEAPGWAGKGIATRLATTPVSVNPHLAGLKHCNRLDSVLARAEYPRSEFPELIMADPDGSVIQGTMSNLLVRKNNQWCTPVLNHAGVHGIVRQRLLALGMLIEQPLRVSDLEQADALAICNSLLGVVPVKSFNQCSLEPHPEVLSMKQELGFLW
ncbi:aminodeoxychorismate lyase [Reinekea blandensis]|uniref:Aminodeoxychorismate lyase n=1 Tax=Reinekea blandensis MED297 TaxID=314283 RepID=A4BDZ0_9GAMM|nr:aminodeoxychorismate lyase [Reinekea blandensis]EAR09749.1 4-amino-4-deoxychorismate lyase [Reinekea blandensis MED297]